MIDQMQCIFYNLKQNFANTYTYGIFDPQIACVINFTLSTRAHVVVLCVRRENGQDDIFFDVTFHVFQTEGEKDIENDYFEEHDVEQTLKKINEKLEHLYLLYSD